ncbi:hypothetical protein [Stenotrophomonas sp. MMGLT7]|uniref:hypothetical protein n=1 Tax=Stenotrophomonas sp. MMGLT7 TaxID=2901227 RepID=UPI001E5320B4|nr:hypothetical protein [Stenotrophomonas sp. MMGLT7]MCD7099789.1 hypothetical protein [Stenotrophomonas sp. MMGLT7]
MEILDHEPYRWFLLEDSGNLLLDANCNHGFIGYDFLVQLTPEETREYRRRGRDYLDWLSEDIHNSAPILDASTSAYKGRDLSSVHGVRVGEAIKRWLSSGADAVA